MANMWYSFICHGSICCWWSLLLLTGLQLKPGLEFTGEKRVGFSI